MTTQTHHATMSDITTTYQFQLTIIENHGTNWRRDLENVKHCRNYEVSDIMRMQQGQNFLQEPHFLPGPPAASCEYLRWVRLLAGRMVSIGSLVSSGPSSSSSGVYPGRIYTKGGPGHWTLGGPPWIQIWLDKWCIFYACVTYIYTMTSGRI